MGEIAKVTWIVWKGVSKVRQFAYFSNKAAAEKFVAGLKDAEEVELIEGLCLRDVEPI